MFGVLGIGVYAELKMGLRASVGKSLKAHQFTEINGHSSYLAYMFFQDVEPTVDFAFQLSLTFRAI